MELEPHILAMVGALTAGGGAMLLIWGVTAAASRRGDGIQESLLAPTLAVDTLDDELRVTYMRTLVLDARLQAQSSTRGATTALGREIRRALLELQASRHAGHPAPLTPLEEILARATARLEEISSADELQDLLDSARAIRRAIKDDRG